LVTYDAEKLIMTSRRPPHKKLRHEAQSIAALFKDFYRVIRGNSGSYVRQYGKRKSENAFYTLLGSCTDQHEAGICTVTSICAYLIAYGPTCVTSLTKRLRHLVSIFYL
jgi:hypothetical protein